MYLPSVSELRRNRAGGAKVCLLRPVGQTGSVRLSDFAAIRYDDQAFTTVQHSAYCEYGANY